MINKMRVIFIVLFPILIFSQWGGGEKYPDLKPNKKSMKNFKNMRFGIFMHWGPSVIRGTSSWARGNHHYDFAPRIPINVYDSLYLEFNPVLFDAEEWVSIIKKSGAKYYVFTTKHYDGFCMWNSKYTDYDIMSTPYKKDVLKELSKECYNQGILFGTYYSICNWHHPEYSGRYGGDPRPVESSDMDKYIIYMKNLVSSSVLPEMHGLEAGQSAVGDIFNWFVKYIEPGMSHEELSKKASNLKAGESGLIALDWNNGNRNILADQQLTGLLLGQTLHTKPEEIYRALIEATAFGALMIIERLEKYGVEINEIINCGGITEKNDLFMQIYADVTGREMKISGSTQSPALGSAIVAGVVAGEFESISAAQEKLCHVKEKSFLPGNEQSIYKKLYGIYKKLHDGFGVNEDINLSSVMKDLIYLKSYKGKEL